MDNVNEAVTAINNTGYSNFIYPLLIILSIAAFLVILYKLYKSNVLKCGNVEITTGGDSNKSDSKKDDEKSKSDATQEAPVSKPISIEENKLKYLIDSTIKITSELYKNRDRMKDEVTKDQIINAEVELRAKIKIILSRYQSVLQSNAVENASNTSADQDYKEVKYRLPTDFDRIVLSPIRDTYESDSLYNKSALWMDNKATELSDSTSRLRDETDKYNITSDNRTLFEKVYNQMESTLIDAIRNCLNDAQTTSVDKRDELEKAINNANIELNTCIETLTGRNPKNDFFKLEGN